MAKHNYDFKMRESEQYAYQVLQLVDSKRYGSLQNYERPDFITPGREIGVEVVSVSPDGSQEAESLFSKIAKGESRNKADDIARLTRTGTELIYDTSETPIGIVEPAYWVTFGPIEDAVTRKLKLLNAHYERCLTNELFIYTEIGPGPEGWEHYLPRLCKISEPFPKHFNRIILNEPWQLIVYEIDDKRYAKTHFTAKEHANCRNSCR